MRKLEFLENDVEYLDNLRIQLRGLFSKHFKVHLSKLPKSAGLRMLISEQRPISVELYGLGQCDHSMLDVRTHDSRRKCRTEREHISSPRLQRVHLFFHDIGGSSCPLFKEGGVFHQGSFNFAESVKRRNIIHHAPNLLIQKLIFWQDVVHPGGCLEFYFFAHPVRNFVCYLIT